MERRGGGSDDTERQLQRALGDCVLDSSWIFSVGGALLSIPLGIRKKSLSPLIFYGTSGAMLDIIVGVTNCEQERERLRGSMAAGRAGKVAGGGDGPAGGSVSETNSESL